MTAKRKRHQKATINDVAQLASVSKKTVSRVINRSPLLNQSTRERVEAAIEKLGYVPNPQARALALRRNFLIGLIHDNPNAQMVLSFQQGVLKAIRDTEFALVVRPVERRSPRLLQDIRTFIETQRPYGILILPPVSENDAIAELCRELDCGYVRMGSTRLDNEEHLVESNDRQAVHQAVAHLSELGHHRIGFVTGPAGFRSASEREAGYDEAVRVYNLDRRGDLKASGNYTFESGLDAGRRLLLTALPPTAIFASNDVMAAGVLHAAREIGVDVPLQLSIVGFDDTAIAAHIWPPLTTVRWPIAEMAYAAAMKLIQPNEALGGRSLFLSELIKRASVARPPASEVRRRASVRRR